jgi:hypothetical protein
MAGGSTQSLKTKIIKIKALTYTKGCVILCVERRCEMATNLALDDKLIIQAQKAGRHKTKKEAVTAALKEYIVHKKQLGVTKLFGTIDFDKNYDYKKARSR